MSKVIKVAIYIFGFKWKTWLLIQDIIVVFPMKFQTANQIKTWNTSIQFMAIQLNQILPFFSTAVVTHIHIIFKHYAGVWSWNQKLHSTIPHFSPIFPLNTSEYVKMAHSPKDSFVSSSHKNIFRAHTKTTWFLNIFLRSKSGWITYVIFPKGCKTCIRSVSLHPSATARQCITREGGVLWWAMLLLFVERGKWLDEDKGDVTDDDKVVGEKTARKNKTKKT